MVRDLTKGDPLKLIIGLSIPLIMSAVLQQLYNTVDSLIVGNFVGEAALAAVGLSFPIMFLINSIMIGMSMGVSVIVSQYFGAKEYDELKKTIATAIIFLAATTVVISVVGYNVADSILRLMNTPDEVMYHASGYLKVIFAGTIFTLLYNIYSGILRAVGDARSPLIFLAIAASLNVVLDLLFVIVFKMGIRGAAIATIISQGVSSLFTMLYVKKKIPLVDLKKSDYVFDKHKFNLIVRFGLPTAFQQSIISIGIMAIQSLVNSYGVFTMAGYSAALRIDAFIVMPYMNVGMALSNYIGQNVGAGEYERAKAGLRSAYKILAAITLTVLPIIWLFGTDLVSMFLNTNNPESIGVGTQLLKDMSFFYIILGMMNNTSGLLRGAGDNSWTLISSIVSISVRITASYWLNSIIGVRGIWLGSAIGWIVAFIIVFSRYKSGGWRQKSVFKDKKNEIHLDN